MSLSRKMIKKRHQEKKNIEKYGMIDAAKSRRGRHGNHARAASHYRWNDGLSRHENGYIKIQVGVGHPFADCIGNAYLHLLVWVSFGNKEPASNEVLHHKNEIVTDNRIENLELKTRGSHAKHHDLIRGRDEKGRFPPDKPIKRK